MSKMENRLHYDRIFQGLTNNRSIDVLVPETLKNVKKMSTEEYIKKYINENNGIKSPQQLTVAIAIALNIPVASPDYVKVFNMVMEEMKRKPPVLAEVSIAIDGKTVQIKADDEGVIASANTFSFDGVASQRIDEETGELATVYYEGDNQVATRNYDTGGFSPASFAQSGDTMTEVPGQFSLPTRLPPRISPVVFNRNGLPDTTQLPYEVDSSLMITPSNTPTSTQPHDGLQELVAPRQTFIRTQTELTPGRLPLNPAGYGEVISESTGQGRTLESRIKRGMTQKESTPRQLPLFNPAGDTIVEREAQKRVDKMFPPRRGAPSELFPRFDPNDYAQVGAQIMSPLKGMQLDS
jgi:hypothetical protein